MTESQGKVLIVEDDESLRRIVTQHLRRVGFEVLESASAEDAARMMSDGNRPDAVLLDVNLPGDTGWDLLRGKELSDAGSPPVIITSAGSVSPKRLAEFRCAGWLPKPFPLETLVDTLARLIHTEGAQANR